MTNERISQQCGDYARDAVLSGARWAAYAQKYEAQTGSCAYCSSRRCICDPSDESRRHEDETHARTYDLLRKVVR